MTGQKSIYQLQIAFVALVERLVDELAMERGIDVSSGLSPSLRQELLREVDDLCNQWYDRAQGREPVLPTSRVECLLSELCALDTYMFEQSESDRPPLLH